MPDLASLTERTYDALGRTTSEVTGAGTGPGTGQGQTTTYTYDIGGRTTRTDDEFTCATTTYDWRDLAAVTAEGLDPGTCGGAAQRQITHSYDALGRLTQSAITAGEGANDVLEAPTYDGASRHLSTTATKAGVTTSSAFGYNPLDQQTAETRSDGGTATSWTKTNYDPAGNPTDRCVWSVNPSTELCKAAGQTYTTTPAVNTTTAYDARNNRTSLKIPGRGETTYDPAHDDQVDIVYVPTALDGQGQVIAEHKSDYGTSLSRSASSRLRCSSTYQIGFPYWPVASMTSTCQGPLTVRAHGSRPSLSRVEPLPGPRRPGPCGRPARGLPAPRGRARWDAPRPRGTGGGVAVLSVVHTAIPHPRSQGVRSGLGG